MFKNNGYKKCQPIFDVLGKKSFYVGASGMGIAMTLVFNMLLGLGLQAVAEAIALGEKSGIEKNKLLDVLGEMAVVAPTHKLKLKNVWQNDYLVNFALRLMYKDFELILNQASEVAVPFASNSSSSTFFLLWNMQKILKKITQLLLD